MKRILLLAAFLAAAVVATGCGGPKKKEVEISGVATIDGEPIDFGIAQFFTSAAEGGGSIRDGKYAAKVPTGELTVRVRGYRWTGPEPKYVEPEPGAPPAAPPARPREECTARALWENPEVKITVKKGGVFDLNFENPTE
ncbi:MAG: hypothetical protein HUK22_03750 [Thermoguttaceae bacterium]|nr:hypothetical protein [Thermoguttaceae bacterium]